MPQCLDRSINIALMIERHEQVLHLLLCIIVFQSLLQPKLISSCSVSGLNGSTYVASDLAVLGTLVDYKPRVRMGPIRAVS